MKNKWIRFWYKEVYDGHFLDFNYGGDNPTKLEFRWERLVVVVTIINLIGVFLLINFES